jgi:ketosteroid isomerase-like protein
MANRDQLEDMLTRNYRAYASMDIETIDRLASDRIVMHIPGSHPLSGRHVGRDAAWAYLGKVAEVSGGVGGFDVRGIIADHDGHGTAILLGTIRDFARPVVHIWRAEGDEFVEYWEHSFDQDAEDAFWKAALA